LRRQIALSVLALSAFLILACQSELTILTYNVKNLFDDVDNGTEYDRFDPQAGKWTSADYHRKLRAVAEVIKKSTLNGPDIVALQEVENRATLDQLCTGYLGLLGYSYRTLVPARGQAVHCAIISRYPIRRVGALNPGEWENRGQRMILEAEIEFGDHTLFLFNNHWKSKTGGIRNTEPARVASAQTLTRRIEELLRTNPAADIVVLGDLNENLDEAGAGSYRTALIPFKSRSSHSHGSLYIADSRDGTGLQSGRVVLYDTWYEVPSQERGSFVYQGQWQTPDHILLSPGLFDSAGFTYHRGHFRVIRPAFLVHSDSGYPKHGGKWPYSDHLPLLLSLSVAK
jgi:endonuclease/exonuclease/phosphatase family metal-dependent hydrolase